MASRNAARPSRSHAARNTDAPLEPERERRPELPIDPEALDDVLGPDPLEVLGDTQRTADEREPARVQVGPSDRDQQRGTTLAGGDVDAAWDDAAAVGDEAVGGSTPTPDQDDVDALGRAAGITYSDTEPLRPQEKEAQRDDARWELDAASSEDYPERERRLRSRSRRRR